MKGVFEMYEMSVAKVEAVVKYLSASVVCLLTSAPCQG